jgi:hypothetical protein
MIGLDRKTGATHEGFWLSSQEPEVNSAAIRSLVSREKTCHQHQDFSWNRSFEVSCAAPDADPNFVLTAAAAAGGAAGGAAGAAASDTAAGHSASAAAADAPAVVTGAALGVAAIDPGTSDTAAAGDPAGGGSTGGVAAGLATAGEITPTNSESHDQNNGSDGSNQKTMHVSSLSLLAVISRSPNAGNGGADRTINRSSETCLQSGLTVLHFLCHFFTPSR